MLANLHNMEQSLGLTVNVGIKLNVRFSSNFLTSMGRKGKCSSMLVQAFKTKVAVTDNIHTWIFSQRIKV
jgi:hypothetical protein